METNPLALRERRKRTGKNPEEERQRILWEQEKGKTFSEMFCVSEEDHHPPGEPCSGFLRVVSHW